MEVVGSLRIIYISQGRPSKLVLIRGRWCAATVAVDEHRFLNLAAILVHILQKALVVKFLSLLFEEDFVLVCTLSFEIIFAKISAPMTARHDDETRFRGLLLSQFQHILLLLRFQ